MYNTRAMSDKTKYFLIGFLLTFLFLFLWFTQNGLAHGGHGFTPVTLCHATHSATNPYETITVDNQGQLDGHSHHSGDIIPAPESGCPLPTPSPTLPTPSNTECEGGDAYSLLQLCPTDTPTPTATPAATLTPTDQPSATPTTTPDEPNEVAASNTDARLAPNSLPMPADQGINK
jgi:hypothetical protein